MKLSPAQQETIDVLARHPQAEIAGLFARAFGYNKETILFRNLPDATKWVGGSTVKALWDRGLLCKVNDDTHWHVWKLAPDHAERRHD